MNTHAISSIIRPNVRNLHAAFIREWIRIRFALAVFSLDKYNIRFDDRAEEE